MTILTAKVEIDPADIANALTPSALAKALMDKLSATARTPGSLEIPCIGAMWPEQGGIYAGIMRGEFGHGYHLIIAPVDAELIDLEWGDDFKMIDGAISDRDGLKNSLAIRDYARSVEKRFPAACLALNNATNGFTDFLLLDETGKPVLTASIATTYAILTELGLDPVVPGAGALLSGAYPYDTAAKA